MIGQKITYLLLRCGLWLLVFELAACSGSTALFSGVEVEEVFPSSLAANFSSATNAPFDLSVLQESYDGSQLSSIVSLTPQKKTDSRIVALRMRLFDDQGQITSTDVHPVSSLLPNVKHLDSKQDYELRLVGKGEELANYQIEVLWGEEALTAVKEAQRRALVLDVEALTWKRSCVEDVCSFYPRVLVRLVNEGEVTCDGIILKTKLLGSDEADSGSLKSVALPMITLEPGASRQVQLKFNTSFSEKSDIVPEVVVEGCQKES